jgi:hypothetical protein
MERRCTGSSGGGDLYAMCREESAFAAGYLERVYGRDTLPSFLVELIKTGDWRAALRNVTGDDPKEIWDGMVQSVPFP